GGAATLNLAPGVYTVTGSFANSSGGTITGTGVTIYLCPGATFDLSGSSSTTLSAPGGMSGFVIFDDSTGSFHTIAVEANLVGRVYAPHAALTLQNLSVQGDVVANSILVHSVGIVTITGTTPTTPSLTTTASGPVTVGGSIHDTAHLSGGSSPTGTISFDVYDSTC